MTFTQEEEEILKLMAAEVKAKMKLGVERGKQSVVLTPLQEDVRTAQIALLKRFE